MLNRLAILALVLILTFPFAMGQAQTDKPKPKLLDGELIEEGHLPPEAQPAQPGPENNTNQTVTLRQEFQVTLPSNPSTGFGWKVAVYDRQYLQLLRSRYHKPERPGPGVFGQQIFEFLPLKSGTTTIIFHYQRPFEKQAVRELRHQVVIK
jgi:inhibitor of cysteine peptidase